MEKESSLRRWLRPVTIGFVMVELGIFLLDVFLVVPAHILARFSIAAALIYSAFAVIAATEKKPK